jgi:hypothetical protein
MNKINVFIILSLLLLSSNRLFCQTLSNNSEVSLITISPGKELFSFAGHTAIRIKDPANGIDANFNYGVFDFRTEGFYIKFLKGTLPYQLGAYNFRDEMPLWMEDGRGITQQVLRLDSTQKQQVFDLLMKNYEPENREYQYKFFYDNCSSRVRDVFQTVCGSNLVFSNTLNANQSFRDWLDIYNRKSNNDWTEFGMNLALGLPADEKTNASRAMYIPDNLMAAFDSAKIMQNGQSLNFVSRKQELSEYTIQHTSFPIKPFMLFSVLFLIVASLTFMEYKSNIWHLWIDKIFFSLTGITGWFLIVLWFLTDHGVMNQNLNLIWAFPLVFPAVLFLNKTKGNQKNLRMIFMIQMVLALIFILGFSILPQDFHSAMIPIAAMVLLRSYFIWKRKS